MIKLFDFQKKLIKNAEKNYMYITDTGTGKTYIGLFHYLKFASEGQKLVIICPPAKIEEGGWKRETEKVFNQFNKNIEVEYWSYIKFINFFKKDGNIEDYLNSFFILDEAHYIKNKTSQRTKFYINFIKRSMSNFILLTATPTPNGYVDYGSYFELFDIFKSAYLYEKTFAIYNQHLLKKYNIRVIDKFKNTNKIDELFNYISCPPLKKEDCLDLPKITFENWYFKESEENKILDYIFSNIPEYNVLEGSLLEEDEKIAKKEEIQEETEKFLEENKEKILKYTRKNDIIKEKLIDIIYNDNFISNRMKVLQTQRLFCNLRDKLEYLEEFLLNTKNNVIVFYNFKFEYDLILNIIKNFKKEDKKEIFIVNGEKKQIPNQNEFNKIKNSVTLVQIQSGGAAIELQYCNEVIYFSPTFNYQDYYQSLGRAYRHGQNKNVSVYHMITKDTIEENVYRALNEKKTFDIKKYLKRKKEKNEI